ncbi:MAG TPA: ATP-binding cassette domain-containing protein [Syntrophomonadaceae bacterium]|nr:ATP-binding cassette domain-containing protein [Syntrophomonadaceae bacterium]
MALIEIENMSYYYPEKKEPALWQLNTAIQAGEFVLVAGKSGSGKSTLLQLMNRLIPDFHGGRIAGEIRYKGAALQLWQSRDLYQEMGMVFQNPDAQLLFGDVERDIAFGLENLGISAELMRRRIAEVIELLNLRNIQQQNVSTLSGGEKQKVALAGVLAMYPTVLLLDEATAHLDPVSAAEFLALLKRLQETQGFTIIMAEQCLHQCLPLVDRVLLMDQGMILFDGTPRELTEWMVHRSYPLCPVLPDVFASAGYQQRPLTVLEGRQVLAEYEWNARRPQPEYKKSPARSRRIENWLKVDKVSYTYPDGKKALQRVTFSVEKGEIIGVVGSNGAGKSTLLNLLMGVLQPQSGRIAYPREIQPFPAASGIAYLPQQLEDYFVADTLWEDLQLSQQEKPEYLYKLAERFSLSAFLQQDPRSLSAGEQQRAALACLFAAEPPLLLLDEPVQGMDEEQKQNFGQQLQCLVEEQGTAAILVSHDMDFVTEYTDRVIFLYQGKVMAQGPVTEVMASNVFYRSQVGLLFRGFDDDVHTRRAAIHHLKELKTCKSTGAFYPPSS